MPEETGMTTASIQPFPNSVPAWAEAEETCRTSPGIGIYGVLRVFRPSAL